MTNSIFESVLRLIKSIAYVVHISIKRCLTDYLLIVAFQWLSGRIREISPLPPTIDAPAGKGLSYSLLGDRVIL
jgi:hypothetical protein